MAIEVKRYGVIHYVAQCDECHFYEAGITESQRDAIRYQVRKHVEKTGHAVNVESGSSTTYRKVP